jgi:hypothetical protein
MTKRKCVYTGQDSNDKDSVIPRHFIKDEHNWSVYVPTTSDYKQQKIDRQPTDLEMQAVETFHLLEMARLKVEFYETQLANIQSQINKTYKPKPIQKPKNEGKNADKKKQKQIKIAEKEKDIQGLENRFQEIIHQKITNLSGATVEPKGNEEILILVDDKGLWDE